MIPDINKTVLITGGIQGLGKYISIRLLDNGYKIIVFDKKNIKSSDDFINKIKYYQIDLNDINGVKNLIKKVIEENGKIDILINNAAIRDFKSFDEFTYSELENYANVNFISSIILTNEVIPYMKINGYGRIIFISSMSAFRGYKTGSLYCSLKSAINRFVEAASFDLKKDINITINVICPDSFQTINGEKLRYYNSILFKIYNSISSFIKNNKTGRVIIAASIFRKIIFVIREIKYLVKLI